MSETYRSESEEEFKEKFIIPKDKEGNFDKHELEKAKRMAGAGKNQEGRDRVRHAEGIDVSEPNFHNPEDHKFYFDQLEELIKSGEILSNPENKVGLFVLTGEKKYFDEAILLLQNKVNQDKSGALNEIFELAKLLIIGNKPRNINKIIEFISRNSLAKNDDYQDEIGKLLLAQGFKDQAAIYLKGAEKFHNIEDFIDQDYNCRKLFIEGILKTGDFDEARRTLRKPAYKDEGKLYKDLYLAAGKKVEDLKNVRIEDIFGLIEEKQVDRNQATEIIRTKIAEIKVNSREEFRDWYEAKYLSELVIALKFPEDIEAEQKLFDEYFNQTGNGDYQIILDNVVRKNPGDYLFHLSKGLTSVELNSSMQAKVVSVFEKMYLKSADNNKKWMSESIFLELCKTANPLNKDIVKLLFDKSRDLGREANDRVVFDLGTDLQKEGVLLRLKKDIVQINRTLEEMKNSAPKHDLWGNKEAGDLKTQRNVYVRNLQTLSLDYLLEASDDEKAEIFEEIEQYGEMDGYALAYGRNRAKDLVKKKEYEKALDIVTNEYFSETIMNNFDDETIYPIVDYLIEYQQDDLVESLIMLSKHSGKTIGMIAKLIIGMYKEGKKSAIEDEINSFSEQHDVIKGEKKSKSNLLFKVYSELMALTK